MIFKKRNNKQGTAHELHYHFLYIVNFPNKVCAENKKEYCRKSNKIPNQKFRNCVCRPVRLRTQYSVFAAMWGFARGAGSIPKEKTNINKSPKTNGPIFINPAAIISAVRTYPEPKGGKMRPSCRRENIKSKIYS